METSIDQEDQNNYNNKGEWDDTIKKNKLCSNREMKDNDISCSNLFTDSLSTKFKKVDKFSANKREWFKSWKPKGELIHTWKSNKSKYENAFHSRVIVKASIMPYDKQHKVVCKSNQRIFQWVFPRWWQNFCSSNIFLLYLPSLYAEMLHQASNMLWYWTKSCTLTN